MFIQNCILSAVNQTYKDWEMIIVDDASNDQTAKIIQELSISEPRIKPIILHKNVGAAEARNIALREAKGQYIAFLDSDDIWYPEKLEYQIQFMILNEIAFSFSSYDLIDITGKSLNKTIQAPEVIDYHGFLGNTIIGCLTVVIDKSKVGYFEMPNLRSSQDMALWLLIMKRGFKAYGLNKILASYRIVPTSNTANKWKAAKNVWRVFRNIERINLLKSSCYFICYAINALKKRI